MSRTLMTLRKVYFSTRCDGFRCTVLNIKKTCSLVPFGTHLTSHAATSVAHALQHAGNERCNETDPEQQKDKFRVVPRKRPSLLSVLALEAVLSEVQKLQLLQEFLLFELLKSGVDDIEVRRI